MATLDWSYYDFSCRCYVRADVQLADVNGTPTVIMRVFGPGEKVEGPRVLPGIEKKALAAFADPDVVDFALTKTGRNGFAAIAALTAGKPPGSLSFLQRSAHNGLLFIHSYAADKLRFTDARNALARRTVTVAGGVLVSEMIRYPNGGDRYRRIQIANQQSRAGWTDAFNVRNALRSAKRAIDAVCTISAVPEPDDDAGSSKANVDRASLEAFLTMEELFPRLEHFVLGARAASAAALPLDVAGLTDATLESIRALKTFVTDEFERHPCGLPYFKRAASKDELLALCAEATAAGALYSSGAFALKTKPADNAVLLSDHYNRARYTDDRTHALNKRAAEVIKRADAADRAHFDRLHAAARATGPAMRALVDTCAALDVATVDLSLPVEMSFVADACFGSAPPPAAPDEFNFRFVVYCDAESVREKSTYRRHSAQLRYAFQCLDGPARVYIRDYLQCTSREKAEEARARFDALAVQKRHVVTLVDV